MKKPKTIYLKDYKPPEFIVDQVDLTFEIQEDQTKVTSKLKIRNNKAAADKNAALVFDKGPYKIVSVIADGMVLLPGEYQSGDDYFKLVTTPDRFRLEIVSILKPRENTSLQGLYMSGDIFCTQCEAQGFREITPFPDRPDVMALYSCTIIADKTRYPVLLSNGNLVAAGDLDNNRHYVRWDDPYKKPSYLFALVAGDLSVLKDKFTTGSGRKVDLKIYSEKENIYKCSHAMNSLKQAMEWDEKRFGLEYDLDLYQIVAINDFNAGAMENKGLNIFNSKYVLADPKTATDEDFMNVQGVIAHEYFHNWTGNRVTLKNWFQLSLKEGLTVFRDQEFSSDLNSRAVKRISCVKNLRAFQFPEDAGPMAHPVRPESYIKMDNFYTMTVYEKGSELIRMIHQILGESFFRKGMDLYFKKFDGMAVTIEDFVSVMEEMSGIDLTQFKLWYSQSGTPLISLSRSYDLESKTLTLIFEQKTAPDRNQKEKLPLHIPVRLGLMDGQGNDITPEKNSLIQLKSEKETFAFENMDPDIIPSVFRQFSAPVKLTTDFSDSDLAFLMAHDSDEFNQWDAAQTLFLQEIKQLISAIQEQRTTTVSPDLVQAFKKALIDPDIDRAFLAKALLLPQETEIKDHYDPIDVTTIHQARMFLKKELALQLKPEFLDIIQKCSSSDTLSLSFKAISDRSLKNLALSYVGSLMETETTAMVFHRFETAENMTDEFAAFRILSQIDPDAKQAGTQAFYKKWHHNKLVLDKWFAVQAGSCLDDTLDNIQALTSHLDFSITNPNKVRSLIYTFAMVNPINFHRADGKGYAFIADQILQLDKINPQIAARLASCFNHWKKYDEKRQGLMRNSLETIMADPALSKNVYEIVSRALE
ncbi:MAG: aminopeptidase N [Desulfobacula sp.]|jgi:aminopeptidase N|nr:aminopeptidase N [Desulfobacula sp.]